MSEQELPKIAMTIVAHPDDAEFGCGGSVAAWVKDGWDVYFVICTDASGGGADDATDVGPEARRKITNIRKAEQREAARILGVKDVIFLDIPDGTVQPTLDLRREPVLNVSVTPLRAVEAKRDLVVLAAPAVPAPPAPRLRHRLDCRSTHA